MYVNTSAVVLTPEGETTHFNINTGVLQGYPLAPYLFIMVWDYALRTAIDDREGLTLTRRRSTRHPALHLSDQDYADDIALFADTIIEEELLLHQVESASKSTGLFFNPSNIKNMHINPSANDRVRSSDGSQIEKVEDTNSQNDIQCRKAQAGGTSRPLQSLESAQLQTHQTEHFQDDG